MKYGATSLVPNDGITSARSTTPLGTSGPTRSKAADRMITYRTLLIRPRNRQCHQPAIHPHAPLSQAREGIPVRCVDKLTEKPKGRTNPWIRIPEYSFEPLAKPGPRGSRSPGERQHCRSVVSFGHRHATEYRLIRSKSVGVRKQLLRMVAFELNPATSYFSVYIWQTASCLNIVVSRDQLLNSY